MATRWKSDGDPMAIRWRSDEGGARPPPLRAARPLLRAVSRWRRPAPRSVTCFAPSAAWASLPLWSVPLRGLAAVAPPLLDRRSVGSVCSACRRFHLFGGGAFLAPIAFRRNTLVVRPRGLFAALRRCPCRAPAPGVTGAPWGTPLGGLSLRSAQRYPFGGFFRLPRCFARRVRGCFPSSPARRGLPPPPPPRVPATCATFFVSPVGRGLRVPCSGASALRLSRGACLQPPAPPEAPTRGAVFFMVLFRGPSPVFVPGSLIDFG